MSNFIMVQNNCIIADNASNAQLVNAHNATTFLADKISQCLKLVPPKAVSNYLRAFFIAQIREAKNTASWQDKQPNSATISVMVLELLTLIGALEDAIQEECNR